MICRTQLYCLDHIVPLTDDLLGPTLATLSPDWWSAGHNIHCLGHIWPNWWSAGHNFDCRGCKVSITDDLQDTDLAKLSCCLMIYKTQPWLPWPHCPLVWWSTRHNLGYLGHIVQMTDDPQDTTFTFLATFSPDWWPTGPNLDCLGHIVPLTDDLQDPALATLSPWLMIHRSAPWLPWLHCPHDWWSTGHHLDWLGYIVPMTDDPQDPTLTTLATLSTGLMISGNWLWLPWPHYTPD